MGLVVTVRRACARRRLVVKGVVQGVGFRPFVHRLANELALDGFVGNDSAGVLIEVEGPGPVLDRFAARLVSEAPPLAVVESVTSRAVPPAEEAGFRIVGSMRTAGVRTLVPPDVAVCSDCMDEVFDHGDRRYRYPFANCTNCGPRFTIIRGLPYDRASTTMDGFAMCPACAPSTTTRATADTTPSPSPARRAARASPSNATRRSWSGPTRCSPPRSGA